jgi:hypothetical protein
MQQRRPPPHIRPKLDLGFRILGHSVEIFEIRPCWRGPPDEKHESPVAKANALDAAHGTGTLVEGERPDADPIAFASGNSRSDGVDIGISGR